MNTKNSESPDSGRVVAPSSAVVARRRILLKGVGKGAALVAATVPIQTLASQSLLTYDGLHQCTVSGMKSGVHSKTALDTTPRCGGFSIQDWNKRVEKEWPPGTFNKKWKAVFPSSASQYFDDSLSLILKNQSTSSEAHWVVAWLNATLLPRTQFPYSPDDVVTYNREQSTDAFEFFTKFMEKGTR